MHLPGVSCSDDVLGLHPSTVQRLISFCLGTKLELPMTELFMQVVCLMHHPEQPLTELV